MFVGSQNDLPSSYDPIPSPASEGLGLIPSLSEVLRRLCQANIFYASFVSLLPPDCFALANSVSCGSFSCNFCHGGCESRGCRDSGCWFDRGHTQFGCHSVGRPSRLILANGFSPNVAVLGLVTLNLSLSFEFLVFPLVSRLWVKLPSLELVCTKFPDCCAFKDLNTGEKIGGLYNFVDDEFPRVIAL